MSMSRTNAPYVVVREVEVAKNKPATVITAPSVSGYSFVCWCGVATVGDVGAPYIANAYSAETTVWDALGKGEKIQAIALYQRD
ncbi:hypothetical protein [Parafannyhessea umbonata]|uniref:Bacterial repeat domain-containing protein n=1 Tax=Parafannyhessea umbonata TaxID=604330 RepID=A0A1H1L5X4_9ACTN|nr:hypothetical protein [Parafannyhessea umbonata]SDR69750.1 hypothetical protein SAMN04489857_0706 [Parafannyhessea umbonata]